MTDATERGPALSDFEEHDYSKLWKDKRLEDAAQKHIIRSWLEDGESCLELGGGFGRVTKILEEKYRRTTMLEFANRNLRLAQKLLSRSGLVRADVARLPLRDDQFDCVAMVRVIHLLPDPRKVMLEILRVVRDRGVVIISVPNLQMNRLVWSFRQVLPGSLRNRAQTYGQAAWPFDERPYFMPERDFVPPPFALEKRRGTGIFDNYLGRKLDGVRGLYLVDVATSPLWFLKLDVFLKFRVIKG